MGDAPKPPAISSIHPHKISELLPNIIPSNFAFYFISVSLSQGCCILQPGDEPPLNFPIRVDVGKCVNLG